MKISIEYSGRNYDRASLFPDSVNLPDNSDLQTLIDHLGSLGCSDSLSPSCLVSVSDLHCGSIGSHSNPKLKNGDAVLVLSPVAGG